jgi:hypothetical protein
MYKNGDPKKKVAKTDATSVTTSRYYQRLDQPLESSNNLFNNKGAAAGAKMGMKNNKGAAAGAKMGMKKTKTPLPNNYYTMNKTKTTKSN